MNNIIQNGIDGLKKVNLSGGGKIALAVAGGIAGTKIIKDHKRKKNKEPELSPIANQYSYNGSTMQYTGMEQQMAADISSYKYGKHMSGFVNS